MEKKIDTEISRFERFFIGVLATLFFNFWKQASFLVKFYILIS